MTRERATRPGEGDYKKTARQNAGGLSMKGVGLTRPERAFGFDFLLGLSGRPRRHGPNAYLELDLVAEDEPARLQALVPGQVEVLAVQLGLSVETHASIAPWILALAVEAGVERHFLGDAMDGQITDHLEVRRLLALDLLALASDGGIIRYVKMTVCAAHTL